MSTLVLVIVCAAFIPSRSGASHKSASTTANGSLIVEKDGTCAAKVTGTKLYRPKIFPSAPLRAGNGYDAAKLQRQQSRPHVQK